MNEENLKHLILSRYSSVKSFAEENNMPYSTVRSILERGIMNANVENAIKICSALGIRPEVFSSLLDAPKNTSEIVSIYNQLEQPRQEKVLDFAKEQLEEQNKVVSTHEELFSVQGVTYAAAASGFGRGFEADEYDTYTVYTDEEPPHYDYAIGVRGDSMLPKYEQGDMLYIVDRGMSAYAGQLCIVVHNGQTYFKKVYTEEDGLRLVSLNKKYNDIFIDYPPAEDTYIKIYDVVGSFTPVEI
ncbi:cI-like repressor [Streptococcus equi subsp. equi]|nr:helix-turn-helix transcriptional regulator [Streptococcus equi]ASB95787.1 phage repressor protein [Streptococcus equi subsp. equi]CRR04505.1 cI-like repressor [Streptococcus equi subsp. equi]CRR20060.1 cI-like repressor [Streptococcus equi subsp. equi]CRS28119.1 cI-like repressor [Streptococcus equi subsp. equi]CRS28813.1 cI-like repressor [Streptococcus equi subsp. equi]